MNESYVDAERHLIQMIEMIRADYQKQVQPYVERLVRLRSLQRPCFILLPKEPEE